MELMELMERVPSLTGVYTKLMHPSIGGHFVQEPKQLLETITLMKH